MADLTQNEKELLAVVRYYASNKKAIARLLVKLGNNFGDEVASSMTGLTDTEINSLVFSNAPKRTKKALTVKAIENAKAAPERLHRSAKDRLLAETEVNPIIDMLDEELVQQGVTRLAIHINAESGTVNRIAYDVAKAIENECEPGDKFWKNNELNERFGSNTGNAPKVRRVLMDHNWIQPVDESNPRLGYVVK